LTDVLTGWRKGLKTDEEEGISPGKVTPGETGGVKGDCGREFAGEKTGSRSASLSESNSSTSSSNKSSSYSPCPPPGAVLPDDIITLGTYEPKESTELLKPNGLIPSPSASSLICCSDGNFAFDFNSTDEMESTPTRGSDAWK
jgi:hypothetical protein